MPRLSKDPNVQELVEILSDMESERSPEDIRAICRKVRKIDGLALINSRIRPLADKHYDRWLREYKKAVAKKDGMECDHCRDECDKWRKVSEVIINTIVKWREAYD